MHATKNAHLFHLNCIRKHFYHNQRLIKNTIKCPVCNEAALFTRWHEVIVIKAIWLNPNRTVSKFASLSESLKSNMLLSLISKNSAPSVYMLIMKAISKGEYLLQYSKHLEELYLRLILHYATESQRLNGIFALADRLGHLNFIFNCVLLNNTQLIRKVGNDTFYHVFWSIAHYLASNDKTNNVHIDSSQVSQKNLQKLIIYYGSNSSLTTKMIVDAVLIACLKLKDISGIDSFFGFSFDFISSLKIARVNNYRNFFFTLFKIYHEMEAIGPRSLFADFSEMQQELDTLDLNYSAGVLTIFEKNKMKLYFIISCLKLMPRIVSLKIELEATEENSYILVEELNAIKELESVDLSIETSNEPVLSEFFRNLSLNSLKKFTLDHTLMNADSWAELGSFFKRTSNLESLSVVNCAISDLDLEAFVMKAFPLKNLKQFTIEGSFININTAKKISQLLEGCEKLQSLTFCRTELTVGTLSVIMHNLQNSKHLQSINFNDNKLEDIGVLLLVDSLSNYHTEICTLKLRSNNIADFGVQYLSSAVARLNRLRKISLQKNCFTSLGAMCLLRSLKNKRHIESVNDLLIFAEPSNYQEIAECLAKLPSLKKLKFSANFFNDRNRIYLYESVWPRMKNLRVLCFDENRILPSEAHIIGNAFKHFKRLEVLQMRQCNLTDAGISPIIMNIVHLKRLTSLDLSLNNIGLTSLALIAYNTCDSQTLKQINVVLNSFSSNDAKSWVDIFGRLNPNIVYVITVNE